MHSDDIRKTIDDWTKWAVESNNSENYDIAIFKIWIKFEKYLSYVFLNYSLGGASEKNYSPKLKLCFINESQFNAFMREGNKKYIEYTKKIETLSDHVFEKNPFDIILKDADRKVYYEQLKAIRNYIAHESEEARRKIINLCFSGNEDKFIQPNDFLKTKPINNGKTYFSIYIEFILDVIESINSEIDVE